MQYVCTPTRLKQFFVAEYLNNIFVPIVCTQVLFMYLSTSCTYKYIHKFSYFVLNGLNYIFGIPMFVCPAFQPAPNLFIAIKLRYIACAVIMG